MQNFIGIQILVLSAALALPGGVPSAHAATTQVFDVGYGWDAGFAYAQPDQLHGLPAIAADPGRVAGPLELRVDAAEADRAAPANPAIKAIPVPGALVLFGSGLLALAVAGRRRTVRRAH